MGLGRWLRWGGLGQWVRVGWDGPVGGVGKLSLDVDMQGLTCVTSPSSFPRKLLQGVFCEKKGTNQGERHGTLKMGHSKRERINGRRIIRLMRGPRHLEVYRKERT